MNIWRRAAEIDFHEARSDAFDTLDKIYHIWGNNMHNPQILVVLKKETLTVALRRMNFISLFIESLLLICSRKMSFQVLFSCSIFYDSDTDSSLG